MTKINLINANVNVKRNTNAAEEDIVDVIKKFKFVQLCSE